MKDPLDIEFKLNRKLAKQLYEQEMKEKVRANLEKKEVLRENEVQKLLKKEAEKQKKLEEAQKNQQEEIEAIKAKKFEKLRAVNMNREHNLKVRE
jgi:hypothetical protein